MGRGEWLLGVLGHRGGGNDHDGQAIAFAVLRLLDACALDDDGLGDVDDDADLAGTRDAGAEGAHEADRLAAGVLRQAAASYR